MGKSLIFTGLFFITMLLLFPVWWNRGMVPANIWDEARLGMNAIEMMHPKHWLMTTYLGEPDLWNTKPPLLIWLQAASLSLFGINEWALRFPSALAATGILALLVFWTKRLGQWRAGVFAAIVLISSPGFIHTHVVRSGDYDTLLTGLLTLQLLFFYQAINAEKTSFRNLYWVAFGLALAAAIMTKSIAGCFFLPGMGIFWLWKAKPVIHLKTPGFWIAALLGIGIPMAYYWAREQVAPGYWVAVWENDLGGRYQIEYSGKTPPWYYLENWIKGSFLPWCILLPVAVGIQWKTTALNHLGKLLALVVILLLGIISGASSRYAWYDAPLYVPMALLIGLSFEQLRIKCQQLRGWGIWLLVLGLAAWPYSRVAHSVIYPESWYPPRASDDFGFTLQQMPALDTVAMLWDGPNNHLHWLERKYRQQGKTVYWGSTEWLPDGSVCIACETNKKTELVAKYEIDTLLTHRNCILGKVIRKKG